MQTEAFFDEEARMKVAAIALVTALLFALPASAGTVNGGHPDQDSDGHGEIFDNCDVVYNPTQTDNDTDGFGDACDCDYDNNNLCDGTDFLTLGSWFGQIVPPAPADVDQDDSLIVDGPDFLALGSGFGQPPGTSCGNPKGTPCP
jgi:hypothetical protein